MARIGGIRPIRTIFEPPKKSRQVRIKIPQPTDRPVHLRTADLLKKEEINKSPWWFVLHKRGVYRPDYSMDNLEARAIPKGQLRGSLPERIMFKFLVEMMHFLVERDFSFQSSLSGGRLQLGGLVVDFMFEDMKLIIQVDGPTHTEMLRMAKDEEQDSILQDMGFTVFHITDEEIYDLYTFENKMRRLFNLAGSGAAWGSFGVNELEEDPAVIEEAKWGEVLKLATSAHQQMQDISVNIW